MKQLFLPFLLILSYCGAAQNYACLNSGVKRYFINSNNYLRGVRVDSVRTLTDTNVYYLYHTPRGNYMAGAALDTGGSWVGGKVIQLLNGTFIFDNYSGVPTTIRSQANLGDSWVFQQDTSLPVYYRATLTAIDTMQVLGVLDTVKSIVINAYTGTTVVPSDPLNGYQIMLSKDHGFQKVFDLYNFPYHNNDYYYDRCGHQSFELVRFKSVTQKELYDWHVHDVYEYAVSLPVIIPGYPTQYFIDTVYNVLETLSHTAYTCNGLRSDLVEPVVGWPPQYATTLHREMITCDSALVFDTLQMPEELGNPLMYSYSLDDSSYCLKGSLYTTSSNVLIGVHYAPLLTGYPIVVNKMGLGLVSYENREDYDFYRRELIYFEKNVSCGNLISLSVQATEKKRSIEIYPSPVVSELLISAPDIIADVTVSNMVGRVIYSGKNNSKNMRLNVSNYPPGLYIVRINNTFLQKFIKD